MSTPVRSKYESAVAAAVATYGPDTVVAYMIGGFYEFYGEQARIAHSVAGLHFTKKGVAGFPLNSLEHMCTKFTDAGYVVVVMDQFVKTKKNGHKEIDREISGVYGPGSPIDPPVSRDSTCCCVVYLDSSKPGKIGYAILQTNTGETRVADIEERDEASARTSLVGAALADRPVQTLVVHSESPGERAFADRLVSAFGSNGVLGKHVNCMAVDPVTLTDTHIRECIKKQFSGCGILTDRGDVYLGLAERPMAARAFAHLIHMVYRKDESFLRIIDAPVIISHDTHLDVAIAGLRQLDIVRDNDDLISHIPRCCTAPGRRAFRYRLCRPLRDPDVIEERYDRVEAVMPDHKNVRSILSKIADIENIHRKLLRPQSVRPQVWADLAASLGRLLEVVAYVDGKDHASSHAANSVLRSVRKRIDVEACEACPGSDFGFFARGFDECLDVSLDHLDQYSGELRALVSHLNACAGCVPGGDEHFRVEVTAKEQDHTLITTQRRFDSAKKEVRRRKGAFRVADQLVHPEELVSRPASSKNHRAVGNAELDEALSTLSETARAVREASAAAHSRACREVYEECREALLVCVRDVEDIDVACACALAATDRGFVRPRLERDRRPFVAAQGLRHPIVESLDMSAEYVGNDIELDGGGMLLYGINGSGKSCFMKSLGISVIMAQAGMFVDAGSFAFSPYAKLFTRIWNNDDIFKGLSSFGVEMTELNEIFKRGDGNSLALGDELCSGTERVSATAIISAGVMRLDRSGCAFLLATHQHDVADVVREKGIDVQVKHLSVDMRDGRLVYHRNLADGCGNTNYGVTVCRALGMPGDFLEDAVAITKALSGVEARFSVPVKRSNYNPSVFMGLCSRCEKRPAVHTHHRVHRATAEKRIKNAARNLEPLCAECHAEEHRGAASPPRRAVQTSSGVAYVPVDIA